ncbi:rhodanese-like domain-containing protein [Halostella sp. JP-L12]|uniref:rhodanese-like domain-containing protein n=1 Tax=Halostella TaxID=1843185 RepID=UPI000EF76982|nr:MULTISPECIES: rhodanese-like domain-containing protein [Halostella]NHN48139.1 rhodanese-like domain-containing protein [Halostella sp. JP-L12]
MDGETTPAEVRDLLESANEDVRVVDIRSPAAFRRDGIDGSVNVPFPRLTAEVERFADADQIVTVCPHGKSSVRAARLIASAEAVDATVESMAGGLEAWRRTEEGKANEGPDAPF